MKKQGRGFSTEFEDHVGMLHKLARTGWVLAQERGVNVDFDDVYQEMCETYCKARNGYDPSHGITFTAYMGRACATNWNRKLGYIKRDQIHVVELKINDDEEDNHRIENAVSCRSHEDGIIAADVIERGLRRLSKAARRVAVEIIKSETSSSFSDESIPEICRRLGLSRQDASRVRNEFIRAFA